VGRGKTIFLVLVAASVLWTRTPAQDYRGSLFVTVTDPGDRPVVSASVLLNGTGAPRSTTTDDRGTARFTRIDPGTYEVKIEAEGFTSRTVRDVQVLTGRNVELRETLEPPGIVESVTVRAGGATLDRRETGTRTVISPEEISKIPTARDPWAVLTTVPGFQTAKVNVGGNYSGEQSRLVSKGDNGRNVTWVFNGIEITAPGGGGTSPGYYDFNSFQEIGVTTAGGSPEQMTAGPQLSFVTKQGANRLSGSFGILLADNDLQATPAAYLQPNGAEVRSNEIGEVLETFFDLSGPIKKDVAWFWVGFAQNDITLLLPAAESGQVRDHTRLQTYTAQIHGVVGSRGNYRAFYTNNNKNKTNREASASRAPETTLLQDGPTPIVTLDFGWFFTPNLELQIQYGHSNGKYERIPRGLYTVGWEQPLRDPDYFWRRSHLWYVTARPVDEAAVRANWFAETGDVAHELKFGFKLRETETQSWSSWGLDDVVADQTDGTAWLFRQATPKRNLRNVSLWAGDTILWNNWTFHIGALWARQTGEQLGSVSPANSVCPECLPEIRFDGFDPGIVWDDVLPRVGIAYTFPTARRQLVRLSAGKYVRQLVTNDIGTGQPTTIAEIDYPWTDANLDAIVQRDEIDVSDPVTAINVDPADPGSLDPRHDVDPNVQAPETREIVAAYEIEVARDVTLGLAATFRNTRRDRWNPIQDLVNGGIIPTDAWQALAPVEGTVDCGDDTGPCYLQGQGDPYAITAYQLTRTDLTNAWRQRIFTNRPNYSEDFRSVELVATKRLSDRWMLRGFVAWQDWIKNVPPGSYQFPGNSVGDSVVDGSPMFNIWEGKSGDVTPGSARWSYNVNGLVQLPRNVTLSANLNGREGYAHPLWVYTIVPEDDGIWSYQALQVNGADDYRYDDLHVVDLGVSWLVGLPGNTTVDLRLDVFNALNADNIFSLETLQNVSGFGLMFGYGNAGRINEVLSPRIVRLGAKVAF
jgi:hypothetical protein